MIEKGKTPEGKAGGEGKAEYLRQYRRKNREKLNKYQREYYADPEHAEKHKEACKKWREHMSATTREKIKAYQRKYYQRRKNENK